MSALSEFHDPLRVILGDRDASVQVYDNTALSNAIKLVINMGKLEGYSMADANNITPAVKLGVDYALLCYETAILFAQNQPSAYRYRTRAFSEAFGNYDEFLNRIEEEIHKLRNGEPFLGWQTWAGFIRGQDGLSFGNQTTSVDVQGAARSQSI